MRSLNSRQTAEESQKHAGKPRQDAESFVMSKALYAVVFRVFLSEKVKEVTQQCFQLTEFSKFSFAGGKFGLREAKFGLREAKFGLRGANFGLQGAKFGLRSLILASGKLNFENSGN